VETERLAGPVLGLDPEDLPALRMEDARFDTVVNIPAGLKGWVELDERLGPEKTDHGFLGHMTPDALVGDVNEAPGVEALVPSSPEDGGSAAPPRRPAKRDLGGGPGRAVELLTQFS
jgi:hypothetical protein